MLNNKLCAVLVPAARYIEPECEEGLRALEERGYHVHRLVGMSAVDQARNILIAQALDRPYQEFVWVDSDMGFNPSDVDRMRRHNKPVVVGLYSMRGKGGVAAEYLNDAPLYGPRAGLFEIRYAGLGFCFTKREVYEKMNLPHCSLRNRRVQPFFLPMIVDEGGEMRYLPEDFAFFYRARSHGFKVLADTSVSLRHYGRHAYTVESFRSAENFRVDSRWGGRDSKPGVHVIMHAHNDVDVIARALQSIEAAMSGYSDWAITVTDTGTDGTIGVLKQWEGRTKAQGFKVLSMPDASPASALNAALMTFMEFPAIAFTSPQSQFMPGRLQMLQWMVENDALLAWGNYLVSSQPARTVKADDHFRNPVMSSTMMHRSLLSVSVFDDTVAGDVWLDLLDRIHSKSPLKPFGGSLVNIEYPAPARIVRARGDKDVDAIVEFYSQAESLPKIPVSRRFLDYDVVNTPTGLGDAVILTGLPESARLAGRQNQIWAPSPAFPELVPFIPDMSIDAELKLSHKRIAADELQRHYDMGNGHFTQRLHRAIGLPIPRIPSGRLEVPGEKVKGRVALHFCPGRHAKWQQKNIHERARKIYPETAIALQDFIDQHPEMEFCEIGEAPMGIVSGVHDKTGLPLVGTLKLLKTCEYFIGIISGPMHLATALGCRCVVIINFPDPTKIFLPTLVDIPQVESEWFYPQHVHLHQEGEGQQVKQFSTFNLERALGGELYPYWTDRYLDLINERL